MTSNINQAGADIPSAPAGLYSAHTQSYTSHSPHPLSHPYYSLYHFTQAGSLHSSHSQQPLAPHSLLLLPPQVPLSYSSPHPQTLHSLHFDSWLLHPHLALKTPFCTLHQHLQQTQSGYRYPSQALEPLFRQLHHSNPLAADSSLHFLRLLYQCSQSPAHSLDSLYPLPGTSLEVQPSSQLDPRLERALHYLHTHYPQPLYLEQVAQEAYTSASTLHLLLVRHCGYNFSQYLSRLRIQQACRLLQHSNLGITQLSVDCGYSSFSHFYTQFKQQIGCSPSTYRSRSKQLPLPHD